MAEKMSEVYEAYDVSIMQTVRGRGAIIIKTNEGIFQLKTPEVNESRLAAEYEFKEKLFEAGFKNIDRCIKNREGELVTFDRYGNPYVMRNYYLGRECNILSMDEVLLAVENLARLHIACEKVFKEIEGDVHIRINSDFRRRNQELKRVYGFVQKKKRKNDFEEMYKNSFHTFFEQAVLCEKQFGELNLKNSNRYLGYCHGAYDHHSVICLENGEFATVNFDRFYVGNQLGDLYHFMRKVVEKNNYDFEIIKEILVRYSKLNRLSAEDVEYIYILYKYPEKFYKISNQYINGSKNRISPKMNEKLERVILDEDNKQNMLEQLKIYKNRLKTI